MKTSMRLWASTACALIMSAAGFAQHYTQTNLVSNTAGVAPVADPQLINPWGLSRNSRSPWWVSDQATGFSTLYNGAGAKQSLIVTIPPADPTNKNTPTGTPTGTIANGSQSRTVNSVSFGIQPARSNIPAKAEAITFRESELLSARFLRAA